jgi:dTDP-4-amino-4,6-dideoxygalactose transaminase
MTNTTISKSYKLFDPRFGKEELEAINKVLKSGILTQGSKVSELEAKFAEYVGSKYAVAVNSCTSALFLSLLYEKATSHMNKVKIPSVTFVSVANMILNAGLQLEFLDEIYVGNWYWLKGTLVIDSAHSLYRGCYQEDSLMCFSFYPTKLLGSCEGGMIATNNEPARDWLRKMRSNGMERKGMFDWDYTVELIGWKMNMNDIQAAIILTRLKKLEQYNRNRVHIRDYYNKVFGLENKSLHVYPLMTENRNEFIKKMAKAGIQCSVHFKPIHLQPVYKKYLAENMLPKSEDWGQKEVSIPLHENMDNYSAEKICKEVQRWKK